MFLHFNKNDIFNFCAYNVLAVILLSFSSFAQIPLSYSDIVDALDKRLSEAEIIKQIEKQKVDFVLKSPDSVDLVLIGASDQLIRTIVTNRKIVKLPITFNGWKPFGEIATARCNKNANVLCKGYSYKVGDFFLYLYYDCDPRLPHFSNYFVNTIREECFILL